MPLTAAGLFNVVKTKLGTAEDPDLQEAALMPICEAIVEYIIANALVTVAAGIAVSTAGSAAAQTGATTAPGTGTIS
jgi:hypothetical protein